jgi:hypothetical protein
MTQTIPRLASSLDLDDPPRSSGVRFTIGTRQYLVQRRWNLTVDGERLDGLCDASTRTIWLDGDLSQDIIVDVLRHEHQHAWEFELCAPHTMEERAQFTATVGAAFDSDFAAAGGLEVLLAMPIGGYRGERRKHHINANPSAAHDHVHCGRCSAPIMDGSIDSSAVQESTSGIYYLDRGCRCPVCDAVQVWREHCAPDGTPLGKYFAARILDADQAAEWLDAHPDLFAPYNL